MLLDVHGPGKRAESEKGPNGPQAAQGKPARPQGGPAARAGRPLLYTPNPRPDSVEVVDENTGEIQRFTLSRKRGEYVAETDPENARFHRYALQRVARSLLLTHPHPKADGRWRVTDCIRRRVGSGGVPVLYSPEVQRAHFGNVLICGSVWVCPCCAAKISERRKHEVVAASDTHVQAGGGLYMVTLTFSHARYDRLHELMANLRKALVWFRAHRDYKEAMKSVGYVGLVRALEVTHGEANGWHPHLHEMVYLDGKLSARRLEVWRSSLFSVWKAACKKHGLAEPNRKRGVHIQPAESAAEYLSKWGQEPAWGAASELTKAHTKNGRSKGRTPFDLLRAVGAGEKRAGELFKDYASAFYGFRQCFWSPGLKAAFGIDEKTDDELAQEQEQDAVEVCTIDAEKWKQVIGQPRDVRVTILRLAENGGAEAVELFLQQLTSGIEETQQPKRNRASFRSLAPMVFKAEDDEQRRQLDLLSNEPPRERVHLMYAKSPMAYPLFRRFEHVGTRRICAKTLDLFQPVKHVRRRE